LEQETAQILAIRALGWLASEEEIWLAFLGASGADAAQVRAEAAKPAMQRAVLAHVLREDDWVRACAAALGVPPEALPQASARLEGRARSNWT